MGLQGTVAATSKNKKYNKNDPVFVTKIKNQKQGQ